MRRFTEGFAVVLGVFVALGIVPVFGLGSTQEGEGMLAKVFSHEMDHLDGLFFVDRLRSIDKRLLSKKLKQIASKKS